MNDLEVAIVLVFALCVCVLRGFWGLLYRERDVVW